LHGRLDSTALRRGLDRIVERHEVLRTGFELVDGEVMQRIFTKEESRFALVGCDLSGVEDGEAELERWIGEEARGSFDLERGPLIRGRLIRLSENEHVLLITMHHIVSDGWSMGVLFNELSMLYGAIVGGGEGDRLPELSVQYADYAVWQRKWIESETVREQAEYWKRRLSGAPWVLELPTDFPRPAQQDHSGAWAAVVLGEELTAGLKELSREQGTTLYMTLLGGWAGLLVRLAGQKEVVIGTPVANRGRSEIEGLIGLFVNTLSLRWSYPGERGSEGYWSR